MSQIIIAIAAILTLLTAAPSPPVGTTATVVAPKDVIPPVGL